MATRPLPPQEFLRQCFYYEPTTGKLWWKVRPREHFRTERGWKIFNTKSAGTHITTLDGAGYIVITLRGKGRFLVHRLIWRWVTGDDPNTDLDHINGKRDDNRWANLRLATRSQSMANCKTRNHSKVGLKGVEKIRKKFSARVRYQGRRYYLGVFKTAEEAHAAYCKAAQRLFGEFACDGKREDK